MHYKQLLDLFCFTTSMQISGKKSSFLYNAINEHTKENIAAILPYKMEPLSVGFKYLGFYLKPLGYHVNDMRWLIKKFGQRIRNWTYRLISLGGILILVKSVLMGLVVYWLTLARIPKTIMNYLRSAIFNFLWGNSYGNHRSHLVDWHMISRPYDLGGWNIKNLDWLSTALRIKRLCLVLNGEGIWSHIVKYKYLRDWTVDAWLRCKDFKVQGTSFIWNGFVRALS